MAEVALFPALYEPANNQFFTQSYGADGVLNQMVINRQLPIVQVPHQCRTSLDAVIHGLGISRAVGDLQSVRE